MNLCDYDAIGALLARHGFRFSKSMGQNFLIDPAIPQLIAETSGADEGCFALEIGPGVGALTAELSRRCGKVISVEVDRSLLPVLAETLGACSNAEIISGDVLKLDLPALVSQNAGALQPVVCANLPYNISTPVLNRLLEADCFASMTLLLQREMAQRVCAVPGGNGWGPLSVLMQYRMCCSIAFEVGPESFYPRPAVTSAVLHCIRREAPAAQVADEAFFKKVVRGAFLLRRKTLANSLAAALPMVKKEALALAIQDCGLRADVRGERLSVSELATLSNRLGAQC